MAGVLGWRLLWANVECLAVTAALRPGVFVTFMKDLSAGKIPKST